MNKPKLRRLIASLLLGVLVGAGLVVALTASRLEEIAVQRDLFIAVARQQRQRLDQLEIQLQEFQTQPVVESIEIHINGLRDGDREALNLSLKEKLRPIAAGVVGKIVNDIEPELIKNLYHNRQLTHNEVIYTFQVRTVVIAPTTHFFLEVISEQD